MKSGCIVVNVVVFMICSGCLFAAEQETQDETSRTHQFNPIVVTGTRTPHFLKDMPVETTVITRQELERSGVQFLSDALRWVPGVTISGGALNGAARRTTAMLRGLSGQYTLILVDGKRVKSEHIHTGVNLNLIPLEMVERIEVIKGSACVLYGSNAMGGVINIITKPITEKPVLGLGYSFGSNNTHTNSFNYSNRDGKLGYFLSGKILETNGAEIGLGYKQKNTFNKFTYDLSETDTLRFDLEYYENQYLKSGVDVKDEKTDLFLGWERDLGDGASIRVNGLMTHFTASNRDTTNDSLTGEIIYQTPIGDKHFLTTGMELRNEDFTRTASDQREEDIFSLYVQDEIQINDSWSTILGIRMEEHPETETVFCPSIALMNKLSEKTTLRASIAKGFKAPTLQEKYEYRFFHKTYFRDGNANLDPEYSTNYSLGLEHRFNDSLEARITAFRHDFKDLIILQDTGIDDGGFDVLQRQNVNEAHSQGIESECRYNIGPNMDIIMGYTYLETEDDDGNPLSYMPKHRTNINLYYNMEKYGLGFWFTLENAWSRTYKDKNDNMQSLDDFTLLNVNITKKINDNTNMFFRVDNVLAEKFTIYEEGASPAGFGRSYTVGLRMTF